VAYSCRGRKHAPGAHSYNTYPNKENPKCANCHVHHSAAYNGCSKNKAATQIIQLASKTGISYAAAVKQQKLLVPSQAVKVSTVRATTPTHCLVEIQTEPEQPRTRIIETQTDDLLSAETQTNEAAEKKRDLSEQQKTGSKCTKALSDLTMDRVLGWRGW